MTTTLAALTTSVRVDLRDTGATPTFSATELGDLIGAGINALGVFYPKEIVGSVTIAASVYSYALPTGMSEVFRVDVYDSDGELDSTLPEGSGSPNAGWQVHADTLFIPRWSWTTGQTLTVWGYGAWTYIDSSSASTATTNLDQNGLLAVRTYVRAHAYESLIADRAKYQQYQQTPGNADATLLGLIQLGEKAQRTWRKKQAELRKMRKTG